MLEKISANDNIRHLLWLECSLVISNLEMLNYCRREMREAKDRLKCRNVDNMIWFTYFERACTILERKTKIKVVK